MTKAQKALDDMHDSCDNEFGYMHWVQRNVETICEALKLLDKVQRGGVDVQQIDELQTLSDNEWTVLTDKYILIERK